MRTPFFGSFHSFATSDTAFHKKTSQIRDRQQQCVSRSYFDDNGGCAPLKRFLLLSNSTKVVATIELVMG